MWDSSTAAYDVTTTSYTIPQTPDAEQIALMDNNYTASAVIDDSTPATIGMFGVKKTGVEEYDSYYFWMEFKPADVFCGYASEKTFRLLFQMGNGSSDWTGVRWYNDGASGSGYTGTYELQKSSIENSKISNLTGNEGDNSTFEGTYDCDNNIVQILRLIERDEQTNDDETIIRIERGRVLDAIYWDQAGSRIEFEITLEGAYKSLIALTAGAIASLSLIAF